MNKPVIWKADILGEEFENTTLQLPAEDDGELVATLIHLLKDSANQARADSNTFSDVVMLYLHGWSDYFYQSALAKRLSAKGVEFYALDLRRYGRSLRAGNLPGYITDLAQYEVEINWAIALIKSAHPGKKILLAGHSTGGLVASLWLHKYPSGADALFLNAPWLEWRLGSLGRILSEPLLELSSRIGKKPIATLDGRVYLESQKTNFDPREPYEVNDDWRPRKPKVYAPWIKAISEGQKQVAAGLDIPVPICVMMSTTSELPFKASEASSKADTILSVGEIAKASLKLGNSVSVERIEGALHDVFLSEPTVRQEAYRRLEKWLTAWLATISLT